MVKLKKILLIIFWMLFTLGSLFLLIYFFQGQQVDMRDIWRITICYFLALFDFAIWSTIRIYELEREVRKFGGFK